MTRTTEQAVTQFCEAILNLDLGCDKQVTGPDNFINAMLKIDRLSDDDQEKLRKLWAEDFADLQKAVRKILARYHA